VEQYSSEEADGEDEKGDGEEGPAGEDRADETEELAGSAVAESDPWNVDELERAQQAVDYEEDWSTDQPAAAPAIAEVESSPVEPDVAGVLPPAVVPFSGVSRVESLKQAVSSVSSVSASDVARSVSSWLGFSKAKEEEELGDLREIEASREAASIFYMRSSYTALGDRTVHRCESAYCLTAVAGCCQGSNFIRPHQVHYE